MRSAFIKTLSALADNDQRVMLLTGDLGFRVVEAFADAHPDRFFNVGVAEANMIGLATGLASDGFIPFCYSIATFASMRGYEQLRNGPIVHELPVRVIGVGGGFAYGSAGMSHFALEDVGLARLQPSLRVIVPADDRQAVSALRATYQLHGPTYYRLTKDQIDLPELDDHFSLHEVQTLISSRDIVLLTYGRMASVAVEAARRIAKAHVHVGVVVVATLSPPPLAALRTVLGEVRVAVALEDHYSGGGLGSLLAEVIAEDGLTARLVRLGAAEPKDGRTGSESFMLERAGLSVDQIVARLHALAARTACSGAAR